MACITRHPAILVRQLRWIPIRASPRASILLNRLSEPRFLAVMRIPRSNRIDNLHHFPLPIFFQHRTLKQPISLPIETPPAPRRAQSIKRSSTVRRGDARGPQRRSLLDRAVTIHAVDLDRVPGLSIQFSIAVTVLLKVAIDAMHSLFQMNIFQVHSLREFVRIIERNLLIFRIEKIALAIMLEDRAKNPSVTMKVGKLCILEALIKFRRPRLFEEIHIGP